MRDPQVTTETVSQALLVCGPSGSGKTTFIYALIERRLAPELTARLPADAIQWPTLLENDIRKCRVPLKPAEGDGAGVIFHYDTFFPHRIGRPDYTSDPIAPYLLETGHLTIVDIRPTPEQLKKQYDCRARQQAKELGYPRYFWKHRVRKALRTLRYRLLGKGWPHTRDLYDRLGTIEECYRSWDEFLRHLLATRRTTRVLQVIPTGDAHEGRFGLLNCHEVINGQRV